MAWHALAAALLLLPAQPQSAAAAAQAGAPRSAQSALPPGAVSVPPGVTITPAAPAFPGLRGQPPPTWHLTFSDPLGTGFDESFLLKVPPAAAFPAPLLVLFHGYNTSELSIQTQTSFEAECEQRGWFLVAPLGASQLSYGCEPSRLHTEWVLDLVQGLWPAGVDARRIYGVGFSMGGGNALNYAARHLDPSRAMFAALVNHTGSVSLADTYEHAPAAQWVLEYWYGGTPAAAPFGYQRASVLSFDPLTSAVDLETDLARNLTHVPLRSFYAAADPNTYLKHETDVLHAHMLFRGGVSELVVKGGIIPAPAHKWSTLDETETCDWLAQHELALPAAGDTLADRDGRYFHFHVHQDAPLAFTPFTWARDRAQNRLTLSATANLRRLDVRTEDLGLGPAAALEVVLSTADGLADEVQLSGYAVSPSAVLRDGVPETGWSFDAGAEAVLLVETDGAQQHVWVVVP